MTPNHSALLTSSLACSSPCRGWKCFAAPPECLLLPPSFGRHPVGLHYHRGGSGLTEDAQRARPGPHHLPPTSPASSRSWKATWFQQRFSSPASRSSSG